MVKNLENQDTRKLNKKTATLTAFARYNATFLAVAANIAADMDLTLSEMVVTEYLHLEGAMTPSKLATRVRLSSGAITALLDRLEQRGLVRRIPNPADRRSVLVEYLPQPKQHTRLYTLLAGYQTVIDSLGSVKQGAVTEFLSQVTQVFEDVLHEE